ncbi:PREDICTED: uncharacterized protein At1g26090, chloroplastic [Nelumbo nucifera]|uniref:Uncharacterized protein At1g26090, chloroplastic n=2 Tax=Nelumbo nucifera TaxID=4432 RepID=A0A1U8A7V7_NELNU|nr:PREDICTED: uncharacterized protein At1g26090, chloroplastic [Nelumbo nucifera]DAD35235.1 TPA_asm: hypothetical protein HUJ06_005875 [Nelumbo nucifera]
MASVASPILLSSSLIQRNPNCSSLVQTHVRFHRNARTLIMAAKPEEDPSQRSTKLVTFLGKGGSGKTASSVLAAQYYANAGLKTCLVIHSQDPTAEHLLGCKIGTSPTTCNNNLSAIRLETTKMLLEPLNRLKQADARLNLTQGVLEGIVGEELGVLPGMDSIFSALAVDKLVEFLRTASPRKQPEEKFDIIIYDGISTEEMLRMIGATDRARWYLKYLRNIAENTDVGRLITPSILRLAEEAMKLSGGRMRFDGRMSAEIWEDFELILERASVSFTEPSKFGCFLTMNPSCPLSVNAALHYWGCAIQAGAQISGAFCFTPSQSSAGLVDMLEKNFSPMPFAFMPFLSIGSVDWDEVLKVLNEDAKNLLSVASGSSISSGNWFQPSVKFDPTKKSVTLFMPGFDKSEIKLFQYRGGSELLVEAGDQRRVIRLPSKIQGKVGGAKFTDRNLVVTMK